MRFRVLMMLMFCRGGGERLDACLFRLELASMVG